MMTEGRGPKDELDLLAEAVSRALAADGLSACSEETIREIRCPANVGRMCDADGEGVADGLCGDTIEMYVKVRGDRIADCTFFTDGCGPTIASGSRLTRLVKGMTLEDARGVTPRTIVSLLDGLPDDHEHCAALAVMALRNALRDFAGRSNGTGGGQR